MNFSELFIRRPIMTLLLTISITAFGIQVFRQLPVNDLPAVDYPVIQVSVNYPGASPETMANTCATPLEKQFLQIPGLDIVTSTSQTGQSTLVLQFSLDKSLGDAATDVQAAISRAQGFLPTDLPQPPSFQKTNPNDQPIFYIALVSDTMTEGDLYDYGNTQLGQQIAIINGVSQVQVYGARSAIRIKVQVNQLSSLRSDDDGRDQRRWPKHCLPGRRPVRREESHLSSFSERSVVESSAVRKCHYRPAKRAAGLFEGCSDSVEDRGGRADQQKFLGT